jgi:hypothetical protein
VLLEIQLARKVRWRAGFVDDHDSPSPADDRGQLPNPALDVVTI